MYIMFCPNNDAPMDAFSTCFWDSKCLRNLILQKTPAIYIPHSLKIKIYLDSLLHHKAAYIFVII